MHHPNIWHVELFMSPPLVTPEKFPHISLPTQTKATDTGYNYTGRQERKPCQLKSTSLILQIPLCADTKLSGTMWKRSRQQAVRASLPHVHLLLYRSTLPWWDILAVLPKQNAWNWPSCKEWGKKKNLPQKMYMKHDVSPPAGHTDSGKNSVLVREICLHLQLNEQAGSSEIDLTVNNRLPYT